MLICYIAVDGTDIPLLPLHILRDASIMAGTNILAGSVSNETSLFIDSSHPTTMAAPIFNVLVKLMYGEKSGDARQVYPETAGVLEDQKDRLVDLSSDSLFTCPLMEATEKLKGAASVYSYYFEAPWLGGLNESQGNLCKGKACHTTDLVFLLSEPDNGMYRIEKVSTLIIEKSDNLY